MYQDIFNGNINNLPLSIDTSNLSWFGQNISAYRGNINDLQKVIPYFEREKFEVNGIENINSDIIFRQPLNNIEKRIPITTVSKTYNLIQHHDVISSLREGIKNSGIEADWRDADLKLSAYGERMQLSVALNNYDFDPGDGHPIVLKINCLNSVDKTTSLEINLSWYRLVCSNGMAFMQGASSFRKVHLYSLSPDDIAKFLIKQMDKRTKAESLYKQWLDLEIEEYDLIEWLNTVVSKEWGKSLAVRAYYIMKTGYDCEVINPSEKKPIYEMEIMLLNPVPGTNAPVKNAFHISQSLSWIAGHRNNIQDRLDKIMQIPDLMNQLI